MQWATPGPFIGIFLKATHHVTIADDTATKEEPPDVRGSSLIRQG
jgi:hypothetical protein